MQLSENGGSQGAPVDRDAAASEKLLEHGLLFVR